MFGIKKKNKNDSDVSTAILSESTTFATNEAYKSVRTNIMFSTNGENDNVIIFTSAIPSDGKTTVCTNVAITFAQTGAKVLLIDADLRKPMVGTYLGLDNEVGLSDFLGGFEDDIKKVSVHIDSGDFDCICAGRIPPNPAELLGSKKMDELIEMVREKYDYVFIDTPPVNLVTDSLILSRKSSGVVIVAREGHTKHDFLRDTLEKFRFAGVKVIGMVLNCTAPRSGNKYSKYAYDKKTYG